MKISTIHDQIAEAKEETLNEHDDQHEYKFQNFWEMHFLDENGERIDDSGADEEGSGKITGKRLRSIMENNPTVNKFGLSGKLYWLDPELPIKERWEYADYANDWFVEINRKDFV